MTTTTLPGEQDRAAAAALLRAVADPIDARPDMPLPGASITFYLNGCGQDTAALMTAAATALPCGWRPQVSRTDSNTDWLDLHSHPKPLSATRGTWVTISALAADVCTPAGARTVTTWQPAAALTALCSAPLTGEVTS